MSYFDEVYVKRVNRFGTDYQSRIQGQREKLFEEYLLKSVYRVDFLYNGEEIPGSLEKWKQDETQTLQYLLVRNQVHFQNGDILEIEDRPWMVYYLEDIKASGYNRYILLKMTHLLNWTGLDGVDYVSWAYMYGQEDNMLKNEIRSRSRMDTIFTENLKMNFFVMPRTKGIKKDTYIVIDRGTDFEEAYVVTGFDLQSTPGVEYVTVDPTLIRDETPAPVETPEDDPDDYFWLKGGNK